MSTKTKKTSNSLNTPVLLIIFRRKDLALKVIDSVSRVKPKVLYISQDGPRRESESQEIADVKKAVLSKINWKCKLIFWSHSKNLGLKNHIPEALSKFFKKERYGIYLEDDTLPDSDFFWFMDDILPKYQFDKRIFGISGCNLFSKLQSNKDSYYLSKIPNIWGAGLYRRSWKFYKNSLEDLDKNLKDKSYGNYFFSNKYKFWAISFFEAIRLGKVNTWDFQVLNTMAKHNLYFINSSKNMIKNIGFKSGSTNTFLYSYKNEYENIFPIKHPKNLIYEPLNDNIYFDNLLKGGWVRVILIRLYILSPAAIQKSVNLLYNLFRI